MPTPNNRPSLASCPICGGGQLQHRFEAQITPIVRCANCKLVFRNPQPSDDELGAIYSEHYFLGSKTDDAPEQQFLVNELKRKTASLCLDQIESCLRADGGPPAGLRLLEVGCGHGNFLIEARSRGYDVSGLEYSADAAAAANTNVGVDCVKQGTIESADLPDGAFDVCVLADVIEHTRDPVQTLGFARRKLKPSGLIFLATPSLDSWSAKAMRHRWMEYKPEHLFYFDKRTLRLALEKAGFSEVIFANGTKVLSLDYIAMHFERFPVPGVTPFLNAFRRLVPKPLRERPVRVVASGINALARAGAATPSLVPA